MDPIAIYFTGTAGVGKTTLTTAFQDWMRDSGYEAVTVNLDPGMEDPAFDPDVDIRDWVNLRDIMAENKLGPNGAQVAASDMVALKIAEVKNALESLRSEYILIDTPGQVELFAFRESSRTIVEELSGDRSMIAFLFDPMLTRHPHGLVSLFMLSATTQFRFRLPMMNILAKDDLLNDLERDRIRSWTEEPQSLYDAVARDETEREGVVSLEFFKALENVGPLWSLISTSASEERGMEDIYSAVQEAFAGGEDLEASDDEDDEPSKQE
jgi:hypothetical protein